MDRSTLRRVFSSALAFLCFACSGDDLNLPSEGDPGSIQVLDGNGQSGQVGGSLPESLVVRVTDSHDRPIQGQAVVFTLTMDPTGQLLPDTVKTDAAGRAASRWKLGTEAGPQEVKARVTGVAGLVVTFSATADPAPPDSLKMVGGNGQVGQIGDVLPESLEVALVDQYGNPIAGEEIQWQAQTGSVSSTVVTTGVNGRAAVQWTLGLLPGAQLVTASYPGINGTPVTFGASATAGPPPRLVIMTQPSTTATSGVAFAQQPLLRVEDNLGNPILQAGISVTAGIASGGGTLGGTTTMATNVNGQVQFTDLAITGQPGTRTLIFAASGHISMTSRSIDVTIGPPSPGNSTVSAAPGTIPASDGTSSGTISVTARDAAGTPIPGVAVILAATGSGNLLTQPGVTDASGLATGSLSSTMSEFKTISATAGGVGISQTATLIVMPGAADPATSTASVPDGQIFQKTTITVTARDAWGNIVVSGGSTIIVTISGSNRRNPITATDNSDGTYTAIYTPLGLGTDTIAITLNGTAISGSPYISTVGF